MTTDDGDSRNERRDVVRVVDRGAETGLRVNNVLSGIAVALLIWAGSSLSTMGKELAEIRGLITLNAHRIATLEAQMRYHQNREVESK